MIYADYLSNAEANRWILDTDIDWDAINPQLALSQPDILDRLRDSALIESFFPIFTPRALDVLWDDVAATAVFSIQLYESYKHFHVFNQYLGAVKYRPIMDEDIVATRRRNLGLKYEDGTRLLTQYMMSEHFAAHHFMKDSRAAKEPVLSHILKLVGRDEVRHAQFAYDLLDMRLRRDPSEIDKVLDTARHFTHIGVYAVPEVPVAEKNDFAAIVTVNQKIQRLTGRGLEAPAIDAKEVALDQRNLCWKLNWYRQSELEGALLLGRMIRLADSDRLITSLTQHCADEARHSLLWSKCIQELHLPMVRIFKSYQSFYMEHGRPPSSLPDVLALTHVFEHRVHQRFSAELQNPQLPEPARRTFEIMIEDERDHLAWIARWLAEHPQGRQLIEQYRKTDLLVYDQVLPFMDHIWDIPGIGAEITPINPEIAHAPS